MKLCSRLLGDIVQFLVSEVCKGILVRYFKKVLWANWALIWGQSRLFLRGASRYIFMILWMIIEFHTFTQLKTCYRSEFIFGVSTKVSMMIQQPVCFSFSSWENLIFIQCGGKPFWHKIRCFFFFNCLCMFNDILQEPL